MALWRSPGQERSQFLFHTGLGPDSLARLLGHTLPTLPGDSELADYEALLTAGLVIPLAIGVDLHTVF